MMEPMRHDYDNVDQADDHGEFRSTTDVDHESLMGDEKQWYLHGVHDRQPARRSRLGRAVAVFRSYRWLIDTGLLVVILVLLLQDGARYNSTSQQPWEVGGDLTGVGPQCTSLPHPPPPF